LTQERDRAVGEKKEVRDKLELERKETARRVERLEKECEEYKKKASDVRHCWPCAAIMHRRAARALALPMSLMWLCSSAVSLM
jgi:hypothetical protein